MTEKERTIKTAREYPLGCGFLLKLIFTLGIYFFRWRSTRLVVTNRRVIWRTGLIGKSERSIPLSRVQDVSISYSVLGRIMRYGNVRVESAGGSATEIEAKGIGNPGGVQKAILEQVQ